MLISLIEVPKCMHCSEI